MSQQIQYSAKFKRDYIAAMAVVIFFAIVICEIALAISIPAYLGREDAMALEVRRLQLREAFDSARSQAERVKVRGGESAELELRLVRWSLNHLAPYLREHAGDLSVEEVDEMRGQIDQLVRIIGRLRDRGPYSVERKLDTSVYIDSLVARTQAETEAR